MLFHPSFVSILEPLDSRRLLAADFVFAGVNKAGVLRLVGTADADHYIVTAGAASVTVDRNGAVLAFSPSKVNGVVFDGGGGNDFVELRDFDLRSTLNGDAGNDTLYGGSYRDTINGGVGADLLVGGSQDDVIHGNGGKDRIFGNAGRDRLFGEAGNDRINAGPDNDVVDAGRGNDTIAFVSGDDTLFGGAAIDTGLDLGSLVSTFPPDGIENL